MLRLGLLSWKLQLTRSLLELEGIGWSRQVATARIYTRRPVESPVLQRRGWVVEFATDRLRHADPLTGWAGGSETQSEVTLHPDERAVAIAYCENTARNYVIEEDLPYRPKLRSSADKFP
jgi:hypothetical protein